MGAVYGDDVGEHSARLGTLEAESNRSFLVLTTLLHDTSSLLSDLASKETLQPSAPRENAHLKFTLGESPAAQVSLLDISNTHANRQLPVDLPSAVASPIMSSTASPQHATAKPYLASLAPQRVQPQQRGKRPDYGYSSTSSPHRQEPRKKKLTKVCKVDQLIQLYQKQPSPVKRKKSVKELLHENLKSGESPLQSLRKNDSISPRMGKLTNKLRSESQEALEKKMKTQKRVTKAARSSMPKVNFCTPKKTGQTGFRSVFVHVPHDRRDHYHT